MDLVANTNVLFSFFNKHSSARNIFLFGKVFLCSPEFALEELGKHKHTILKRFSIDESHFKVVHNFLKANVLFVPENMYSEFLSKAKEVSPDPNDIDFFALALKLGLPLWSNDKELKKQSVVKVYSTKELIEILSASE